MKICALASGSNGNAYYIEHQGEAILVDAGISRRQLLQRMKEKKLSISLLKGVFISHEHADHIRGFRVLCDMQKIPGYISNETMHNCRKEWLPAMLEIFHPGESLKLGNFNIHCFAKSHDAAFMMLKIGRSNLLLDYHEPASDSIKKTDLPDLRYSPIQKIPLYLHVSKTVPNAAEIMKKLMKAYVEIKKDGQ